MLDAVLSTSLDGGLLPAQEVGSRRLRPIGTQDRDLIRACFAQLSPASRRLRFFGAKQSLSEADIDFLAGADGCDHIALGLIELDAEGVESALLGAARCVRLGPGSDVGELAMAVIDRAQGQGIGRRLLEHLAVVIGARGIRRLRCEVLAGNDGMRALLGDAGRARWLGDGVLEYEVSLEDMVALRWEEPDDQARASSVADLGFEAWSSGLERLMTGLFLVGRWAFEACLEPWPLRWGGAAGVPLSVGAMGEARPECLSLEGLDYGSSVAK